MTSARYKMWKTTIDSRTCIPCKSKHGSVYHIDDFVSDIPLHPNCRCVIERLQALFAGTATELSDDGADWWLLNYRQLPDYYVSKADAKSAGWVVWKGNLSKVCQGKMLYGGVYNNKNRHLPSAPGRVWYEADINYTGGYRGSERIVFSNDGLVFVTYDHYRTFIEII